MKQNRWEYVHQKRGKMYRHEELKQNSIYIDRNNERTTKTMECLTIV